MKRVMIVGGPGSGKSTLARLLGARTGLPVFHMDQIHWKSGWIERTQDEKVPLVRDVLDKPEWIFEGGHTLTMPERVACADTMIWLDVPVAIRFWRVIHRSFRHRGQTRPDLPEGCPEQINVETFRFLAYIWTSRNRTRAVLAEIVASPPSHLSVRRLTTLTEVEAFLQELPPS